MNKIIERVSKLDKDKQARVLEFVRSLDGPPGIAGEDLIARARQADFDPSDLEVMARAIEEGCERIETEADR